MKPKGLVRTALAGLLLSAVVSFGAAAEESEYGLLVEAEESRRPTTGCIACHSERIVAQQGLTRKNWDKLLEWMVEEQGMPGLDPETETIVLDYLATHYNVDRPEFFPSPSSDGLRGVEGQFRFLREEPIDDCWE